MIKINHVYSSFALFLVISIVVTSILVFSELEPADFDILDLRYVNTDGDNMSWILRVDQNFYLNDTSLEEWIDDRIALSSAVYLPISLNVLTGVTDSGNIGSVQNLSDDNTLNISEVGGSPGFEIIYNFTNVTDFTEIYLHLWYEGSPAHTIDVYLYDHNLLNWDLIGSFTDMTDFEILTYNIGGSASYVSNGNATLRMIHSSSGNPSHDIFIDYVALNRVAGITTDHGSLSGLTDDDHNIYVHTDARRGITDNFSIDGRLDVHNIRSNKVNTIIENFNTSPSVGVPKILFEAKTNSQTDKENPIDMRFKTRYSGSSSGLNSYVGQNYDVRIQPSGKSSFFESSQYDGIKYSIEYNGTPYQSFFGISMHGVTYDIIYRDTYPFIVGGTSIRPVYTNVSLIDTDITGSANVIGNSIIMNGVNQSSAGVSYTGIGIIHNLDSNSLISSNLAGVVYSVAGTHKANLTGDFYFTSTNLVSNALGRTSGNNFGHSVQYLDSSARSGATYGFYARMRNVSERGYAFYSQEGKSLFRNTTVEGDINLTDTLNIDDQAFIYHDGTNLIIETNRTNSDSKTIFLGNISANAYETNTQINTDPDVLTKFRRGEEILVDGRINHTLFDECYKVQLVRDLNNCREVIDRIEYCNLNASRCSYHKPINMTNIVVTNHYKQICASKERDAVDITCLIAKHDNALAHLIERVVALERG